MENKSKGSIYDAMIGKYCVVRCDRSGVFAGTVVAVEGQTVRVNGARRIHYWSGAASLSQLATEGVKRPEHCRFAVTLETILVLDAIEIIPTTAEAEANIKAVPVWKM